MTGILIFVLGLGLCLQALIGLSFFISSIWEKEKRASALGGLQFLGMLVLVILFFILNAYEFFDKGVGFGIMILVLALGIAVVLLLFSRIGVNPKALQGTQGLVVSAVKRWDERDIQFSNMMRMMYMMTKVVPPPGGAAAPPGSAGEPAPGAPPSAAEQPGKEAASDSPAEGPELKFGGPGVGPSPAEMMGKLKSITDEEMNNAGLGPLGPAPDIGKIDGPSGYPLAAMTNAAAAMQASFTDPAQFAPHILDSAIPITPEAATSRVKGYTRHLGAVLVGITELNPNWLYSHRGVSEVHLGQWGKKVELGHKYAIVFAEEMDRELIDPGPHSPIVMESMTNYAKGAFIGIQLATFIANMGYPARANFGAHYDALMVPLAVDAGLGELSRMGYLISKEYGPRIRLSAVTTDLPLIPDKPVDIGVRRFCTICKKCAHCCPSKSIPLEDDPVDINGTLRWKLNDLTCFMYWQKVGTDCGVCMRVCPWAHARTFPHKIIVEGVSRNKISRSLFNYMDDLFYGKKPRPKDPPDWANFKTSLINRPPTKEAITALSGTWKLTVETPMGTDHPLVIFREEDNALRGMMDGKMGKPELEDIRIDGANFSFKAAIKSPMGPMKMDFSGVVEGDSISGNFFSPMGPTQFTGEKQ